MGMTNVTGLEEKRSDFLRFPTSRFTGICLNRYIPDCNESEGIGLKGT